MWQLSCSDNASFDNGPWEHGGPTDWQEAIFIKWSNVHIVEKKKKETEGQENKGLIVGAKYWW